MNKDLLYFTLSTLLGAVVGAAFGHVWIGAACGFLVLTLVYAAVWFIGHLFVEMILYCFDSITGNKTTRR